MLPQRRNKAIAKRKFASKLISWVALVILFLSLSGLPTWTRNTPADVQVIDLANPNSPLLSQSNLYLRLRVRLN
ncbi:MAG: hypothetical protein N4J56_004273 [Chroococcidiopsis sp. SAG 2025]|uniref:hypothetical protein n=1 Tax=Chroococcidiopsis sp. SAG 2025 TaxID=171389 RepID=UPI0029373897|nr:hypothetical protein [Chroococcidiopsis sp. SAG 2025]MDV2994619.1 hypothetical protein [Chroococcidiopsis sp. SAG 2025]